MSIDESLVDAACVPDVANNGLKVVKNVEGSFVAWPKDQVIFEEVVRTCVFSTYIYNYSYVIQCLIEASFVYYRLHQQTM